MYDIFKNKYGKEKAEELVIQTDQLCLKRTKNIPVQRRKKKKQSLAH